MPRQLPKRFRPDESSEDDDLVAESLPQTGNVRCGATLHAYQEAEPVVQLEDEYSRFEQLETKGELQGRFIWQYLVDILTGSTFRPYIYWTGNGLEFKIENAVIVFTELYKIRRGEQPSTMLDPMVRWRGNMLDQGSVNWYLRKIIRRTTGKPTIMKSSKGFYWFTDHKQICDRLGWDIYQLLTYTHENSPNRE